MNNIFGGPIAAELLGFLQFKRDLGYGYRRAEFTLREFDRFLIKYVAKTAVGNWIKPRSVGYRASQAVKRSVFPTTRGS